MNATATRDTNQVERPGRFRRFVEHAWFIPVLLVLASLLAGVVHVPKHESLSPIDEYVYVDYFDKVLTQGVVREGEEVGEYARRELGCRGLRILLPVADDRCTTSEAILGDDGRFPMDGLSSADIYTPIYFAVTRALAEPLLWTGLVESPTQAGRFIGSLWIAAAAVALFFALRRLRIPRWIAAGTVLLLVGSLPAYWYGTYLSTDAPTMFVGAGLLLLAVRYLQGAGSGWWLVAATPIAIWLKFQNFAAVGAVALTLAITALQRSGRAGSGRLNGFVRDGRLHVALGMVAAALAAQGVWLAIRAALSLGLTSDQGTSQPFGLQTLLGLFFRYLGSTGSGVGAPEGTAIFVQPVANWIAIAGVIGLAATARPASERAAFAYGVLLMALILGPLLAVTVRLTTGYYFPLPERYGLSLFPMFIAAAALLVRERRASAIVLAALGAITYVASLGFPE